MGDTTSESSHNDTCQMFNNLAPCVQMKSCDTVRYSGIWTRSFQSPVWRQQIEIRVSVRLKRTDPNPKKCFALCHVFVYFVRVSAYFELRSWIGGWGNEKLDVYVLCRMRRRVFKQGVNVEIPYKFEKLLELNKITLIPPVLTDFLVIFVPLRNYVETIIIKPFLFDSKHSQLL